MNGEKKIHTIPHYCHDNNMIIIMTIIIVMLQFCIFRVLQALLREQQDSPKVFSSTRYLSGKKKTLFLLEGTETLTKGALLTCSSYANLHKNIK